MFSGILKYIGVTNDYVSDAQRVEIAQKLLHQGLKRPELKDELYMQLIKQTRGNTSMDACLRTWEIFHLVTATMPPSKASCPRNDLPVFQITTLSVVYVAFSMCIILYNRCIVL